MCPIPFIKGDDAGSLKRRMQTWVQVSEKFLSLYLSPRIMGDRSLLSLPGFRKAAVKLRVFRRNRVTARARPLSLEKT